ncbi:hypothetical protein BDF21DRAFT_463818 [Thamnidium elegans]|nr:hypothetical protein BDF21DRAFT_463818 [Thamnidium elegans]
MSVKTAIAHHPYEAEREDEISFEKEEVIKVTDFSDPDWWVGKKKDGSLGFFPSNFVTVLQDAPVEQPARPEQKQQEDTTSDEKDNDQQEEHVEKEAEETQVEQVETPVEEKKVDKIIGMARVMEDYAMQEQGELSLHRGGIINVYEVINDTWSRGELNGKVGKYPHKCVEDIDMPGRPDLGIQSIDTQNSGEDDAPKGGFKLAAFGVKQGGIGSLLAGGFPGLKKTPPKESPKPEAPTVPVAAPASVATTPAVAPVSPAPANTLTPSLPKAIVLHPYDAEGEDELSLLRGEYVEILDRHADEGWWKGRNERGLVGVFPVNFVRELEEETLAPPTPTRSRKSAQTGSVIRPASVQTPVTTRPISVQAPAQRPSSISHSSLSPRISEQVKEEDSIEEEGTAEEEEEEVVVKEKKVESVAQPVVEPAVVEPDVVEPDVVEPDVVEPPVAEPPVAEPPVAEPVAAEPVAAEPVAAEPVAAAEPAEKPVEKPVEKPAEKPAAEPVAEAVTESVKEPVAEDPEVASTQPMQSPPVPARATSFSEDSAKPLIGHVDQSSPAEDVISDDEEKETSNKETSDDEKKEKEDVKEPEKFDDLPTGGPKLTTPARARIGRARRSPQITSQEPSQTEIFEKELQQEEEEEKTTPSPPAKPVKPIFAKFPTPFAVGGDVLSKAHLKPTQTRRLWEEKANEVPTTSEEEQQQPTAVRPSGVKNLASRFNFAGGNSGGNEVLETKLKNHTKNELERVRKECEQLVNEEREKRIALEQIVQDLMERVKALEQ